MRILLVVALLFGWPGLARAEIDAAQLQEVVPGAGRFEAVEGPPPYWRATADGYCTTHV